MKTKLKFIATQYCNLLIELSGFVTVFVVFSSGIGRYRVFIAYAAYSLLKSLSTLKNIGKAPDIILLPAIVIAIYFDLANGPIFPLFTKNYFFIALPVLIIADVLIRNLIKRMICNVSDGELFGACPFCNFDNKELVRICVNCNYNIHKKMDIYLPRISQHYKGDKIKPELLSLLSTNDHDEIVYHKKLTRNLVFYKNDTRELRKHFIITTSNLIFIDYQGFYFCIPKSYRNKDIVFIDKIDGVKCEMKNIYMANRPFLEIRTIDGDCYGIAFSSLGNYKDEMTDIVNLITNTNPQVKTTLNI
jgi:hypothetical protein